MPIPFGAVTLDPSVIAKQLRGDMKDDWFFDPLNYSDMLHESTLAGIVQANFEKNDGLYQSGERHIFNVPKPNFTLRYALETSLSDRFLYHGLVAHLVPFFDKLLGPSVYSHRYNYDKPDERYLFRRGIPAWGDFIGSVKSALEPGSFLVSTDLTNYYEGVNLTRLKSELLSLLPKTGASAAEKYQIRQVLDDLFRCLANWTFDKERGLPQNRDASSFLANIYMHPIDQAMHSLGYGGSYFRYMDDIKIVCPDEFTARKALKHLILELRGHGLAVNAKKTSLTPATDTAAIEECLQTGSQTVAYLDSVWRTNNPSLILGKTQELRAYSIELLKAGKFDSREFRFCIKRLYNLRMCASFSVPDKFFEEITPKVIEGLTRSPAATDQIAKYLRAAPLAETHLEGIAEYLLDKGKCIYGWQNYQLWSVLTAKQYTNVKLFEMAADRIAGPDDPSRAGATLYAGALGDKSAREHIAKQFHSLHSFFGQRVAVIAVHELPFKPIISQFVAPHLRPDLLGVYKQLKVHKGDYVNPLDPILLGEDTFEEHES
jgi:hypothetical protein